MWDTVIVIVIVTVCAFFVGRRMYRQFRGGSSCGCGCGDGCSVRKKIHPSGGGPKGRGCGKDACP